MPATNRQTELASQVTADPLQVPVEQQSRAHLEQTFALFNQMSSQLNQSYSLLEARVTELKGELALVSAQRMQELAEKERLANLEQGLIQQALDDASGVVARAAERLRIRRTTLVEKMRKYGMSRREEEMAED